MIEISEKEFLDGKYDTLIINALKEDNLIIFPSESSYGFAGDANSTTVCKKIHSAKKEDLDKPIGLITDNVTKVEPFLEMAPNGKDLLEEKFSSPLTILFKKKIDCPCTPNDFIGIRIPLNKTALKLCSFHSVPLTSTSATLYGNPAVYSPKEIKKYFGKTNFIFINAGELQTRAPSTCYHFDEEKIIRAGEIPLIEIEKKLK